MVPTLKDNVFKALMWQTAHFQQSIWMRHIPSDEVVRFLNIYAILCQGWCQIFHCQRVFLVLACEMNSMYKRYHIFILYKLWPADSNIHYITDNCMTIWEHKPWPCFESFQKLCPSFCSAVVRRLQCPRWTSAMPVIWDGFWQHTRGYWCKEDSWGV